LPKERTRVTPNKEAPFQKGYKRRTHYEGWGNFTEFEQDFILKVKHELKARLGVDLD